MGLDLPEAIIGTAGGDYFKNFRQDDFLNEATSEYIARVALPFGISESRKKRFLDELQRIDKLIDLDFFLEEPGAPTTGSLISVYEINDPNDSSPGYSTDFGDIYLNLTKLSSDRKYGNTLFHELGHVIGLHHPWEDGGPGGEATIIDDPDRFSDEQTIMAYRSKTDDDERFRDADIRGLQMIWGEENGSSLTPVYSITPLSRIINEGSTLHVDITTTNAPAGTTIYWEINGDGVERSDVDLDGDASTRMSLQLGADGRAAISLPIAIDFSSEGDESLTIRLFSDAELRNQVGESARVLIRDTSSLIPSSNSLLARYNMVSADKTYQDPITSYRFARLPEGSFGVEGPGTNGRFDNLASDAITLRFADDVIFPYAELKSVFDQVRGFDDITGQVFRLYNAAFKRIPDANGFAYWNTINSSQQASLAQTALYFTQASEFISRYGNDLSNKVFVSGLYNNILGRDPDTAGLAFWESALSSARLDRAGVLLEFAESIENKQLFSDATGLA